MGQLVRNSFSEKGIFVRCKERCRNRYKGSYYMNGNTAKKIEVQAENTALKMSNMQIRKSGISRILHGHSVYLELQLEQGCSFTD